MKVDCRQLSNSTTNYLHGEQSTLVFQVKNMCEILFVLRTDLFLKLLLTFVFCQGVEGEFNFGSIEQHFGLPFL
jgi:hypothetical protein